jgi:hypothetical protein
LFEDLKGVDIILTDKFEMKGKTAGKGPAKKKIERPGLTEDEIEELREAFNLFDTEATGKIDPRFLSSYPENSSLPCKVLVSSLKIPRFSR